MPGLATSAIKLSTPHAQDFTMNWKTGYPWGTPESAHRGQAQKVKEYARQGAKTDVSQVEFFGPKTKGALPSGLGLPMIMTSGPLARIFNALEEANASAAEFLTQTFKQKNLDISDSEVTEFLFPHMQKLRDQVGAAVTYILGQAFDPESPILPKNFASFEITPLKRNGRELEVTHRGRSFNNVA